MKPYCSCWVKRTIITLKLHYFCANPTTTNRSLDSRSPSRRKFSSVKSREAYFFKIQTNCSLPIYWILSATKTAMWCNPTYIGNWISVTGTIQHPVDTVFLVTQKIEKEKCATNHTYILSEYRKYKHQFSTTIGYIWTTRKYVYLWDKHTIFLIYIVQNER